MSPLFSRATLSVTALLVSLLAHAATIPTWQVLPNGSTITFTATQNNAPVTGSFKNFTADINADPAQLANSKVRIVVDMASVNTSYPEIADTLKTEDWFGVKLFPQAVFEANKFIKTGNNAYQAQGTLTIRDKTLPLTVNFVTKQDSETKGTATGTFTLKRTLFGVGSGEWSKTTEIKNAVVVNFALVANKQ